MAKRKADNDYSKSDAACKELHGTAAYDNTILLQGGIEYLIHSSDDSIIEILQPNASPKWAIEMKSDVAATKWVKLAPYNWIRLQGTVILKLTGSGDLRLPYRYVSRANY